MQRDEGKITLDYIQHDEAREVVAKLLKERDIDESCIHKLHCATAGGYVAYRIQLYNGIIFEVMDDGTFA